jgi:hypothetical protein
VEAAVARIEALIHQDVGRGIGALFAASRGGLLGAAAGIAGAARPRIGILTGFYIPAGVVPAAETDGPAGAALLALGFSRAGLACRVLTDDLCRDACVAALAGAGVGDVAVETGGDWGSGRFDWVIAIERCGRTADGTLRNMRGAAVAGVPLDDAFVAGPWRTVAIGDGGNEVGMGALPPGLIAEHVAFGETIACVTPTEHLIVAGVSHWGAYALLAALALLRADWRDGLMAALDPAVDRAVVAALVDEGPAVDGVTLRREPTIDGLDMAAHAAKLLAVRRVLDEAMAG